MDKMYNVSEIFKTVASKYDLMNDLMSFGIHRYWKDCLVGLIEPRLIRHWYNVQKYITCNNKNRFSRYRIPDLKIVDLAGGTGDVAFRINDLSNHLAYKTRLGFRYHCEKSVKYHPKIIILDPSEEMMLQGQNKLRDQYVNHSTNMHKYGYSETIDNIDWIVGSAEKIPLPDTSVDIITIAFGARNFDDLNTGISECRRVLKPKGELYILEFSKCVNPIISSIYSLYSHLIIPKMGKLISNEESYQYLVDSIDAFPNQDDFAKIIKNCGFGGVFIMNLFGGIVAIHKAIK